MQRAHTHTQMPSSGWELVTLPVSVATPAPMEMECKTLACTYGLNSEYIHVHARNLLRCMYMYTCMETKPSVMTQTVGVITCTCSDTYILVVHKQWVLSHVHVVTHTYL